MVSHVSLKYLYSTLKRRDPSSNLGGTIFGRINMETYKIGKYSAFSTFKKNVGNNNQFLVTALIGINKIDESDKGKKDPAPWSPCNIDSAKARSRDFVKKAGLTWTIDCLDELLKNFFKSFFSEKDTFYKLDETFVVCIEKTNNIPSELKEKNKLSYEQVNRSVYWKFTVVSDFIKNKKDDLLNWRKAASYRIGKNGEEPFFPELELVFALIDLAIQWRNNLVHNGIDNPISMNTLRVLKKYKELLASNQYGTLDISIMLDSFKKHKVMSFKELSVMIRNAIDFGFILNAYWINEVNKSLILNRALSELLPLGGEDNNEYFLKLHSLSPERQKGNIIMTLGQKGVFLEKVDGKEKSEEEIIIDHYLSLMSKRAT